MPSSESSEAVGRPAAPPRRRRRSGEVDELILDAARELFASKGYAGTSSREIAIRADVHEPSIYRRFGSKAGLFEAAVLAPFNDAISAYLEAWDRQVDAPATVDELVRNFIEPFFAMMLEQRELVLALLAAREFHAESVETGGPLLDSLLRRMDTQAGVESLRRGLGSSSNAPLTVRVAAGLVMGMALLSDWLTPAGPERPTHDQILDEMVRLVTYGVVDPQSRAGEVMGRLPAADRPDAQDMSPMLLDHLLNRLADAERRAIRAELEVERLSSGGTARRHRPAAG